MGSDFDFDAEGHCRKAGAVPAPPDLAGAGESIVPAEMVGILPRLTRGLSPERSAEVLAEVQSLALREAVAAGGSFAFADLEEVLKRVEALLLLGLEQAAEVPRDRLDRESLGKLMQAGARPVERLRQVALRLRPLCAIFDAEQRALIEALCRPVVTLDPNRRPVLAVGASDAAGSGRAYSDSHFLALEEAGAQLERTAVWAAVARGLTLRHTEQAMSGVECHLALVATLSLGAVIYGRVELGLAEASDLRRFAARYLTPRGRPRAAARSALRRTLEPWAAAHRLPLPAVESLFTAGLGRLAEVAAAGERSGEAARRWLAIT
jgi:hypothetical protein